MISFKLQIMLLIISILLLFLLINMIRKYLLDLKYSLLWLLLSVNMVIFSLFPSISFFLAESLGVESPVNALFLISIIGSLCIIFSLTVALSRMANKIRTITQELGILKQEINDIKINNKEKSTKNYKGSIT